MATIDKIDTAPTLRVVCFPAPGATWDKCVDVQAQHERLDNECREHLIAFGILDKYADEDAATAYFENECDQECSMCDACGECPVVERYGL